MNTKHYLFIFLAIILLLSVIIWKNSNPNWDIVPYTAIVLQMQEPSLNETALHQETYNTLKKNLAPTDFANLVKPGNDYRVSNYHDPAYFSSQLIYYKLKHGYNYLNTTNSYITGNALHGIALTSVLGWLLLGIVSLLWYRRAGLPGIWPYLLAFGTIFLPTFIEAARTATPDAISAAAICAALYAYYTHRLVLSAVCWALAITIRPDNMVFVLVAGAWLLYEYWQTPHRKTVLIAGFALSLIAGFYLWIGNAIQNTNLIYQEGYIASVVNGARGISYSLLPYLFLFTCMVFATVRLKGYQRELSFSLLLWVSVAVKFLVVPTLENRFFLVILAIQPMLLAKIIYDQNRDHRLPAITAD